MKYKTKYNNNHNWYYQNISLCFPVKRGIVLLLKFTFKSESSLGLNAEGLYLLHHINLTLYQASKIGFSNLLFPSQIIDIAYSAIFYLL